jgi:predicted protein tyrosine phosphatase
MRFLCICDGGNVRSRALAYVLHDLMDHEAIPIGRRWASHYTMRMLCEWADVVVVMQPNMIESVPHDLQHKVRCIDVGEDRYGLNISPDLIRQVTAGAEKLLATSPPAR